VTHPADTRNRNPDPVASSTSGVAQARDAAGSSIAQASALLTDLYQLTMIEGFLRRGMDATAVFEFFVRALPGRRGFLLAAGLEQVLEYLEQLHFTDDEIEWLTASGRFSKDLVARLAEMRFTGDVDAIPEGTVVFSDEPLIRITAPLHEAQLIETRLINLMHLQTTIASKAARIVLAAPGKLLVDFGLRRAHGAEAGLLAARAAYLAGFAGSATVEAERLFGVPAYGTVAHSFIQAYDDESQAFLDFAHAQPENAVLLIDTYDTVAGAKKVVAIAPRLSRDGITIKAVRLDSGNLASLARKVRRIFDAAGLVDLRIFASGGLDEYRIKRFVDADVPIDGYGVGTSLTTSSDAPSLDCAYKLQEYAGEPRRKRSTGKTTWPGRKQVYRRLDADGRMAGDVLTVEGDVHDGTPMIRPVMRGGRRLAPPESLVEARGRAIKELERLPEHLRRLEVAPPYPVTVAPALRALAARTDAAVDASQPKKGPRVDR
jgi:nicotinate phosphoribosyltransferase